MSFADNTARKQRGVPFKPGQSGNPAGRPKGSRNALAQKFIEDMHADFEVHGKTVIETVRAEKPDQYLKVIASLLPKELVVTDMSLEDMSDNELTELLAAVRSLSASTRAATTGKRTGKAKRDQETGSKPH